MMPASLSESSNGKRAEVECTESANPGDILVVLNISCGKNREILLRTDVESSNEVRFPLSASVFMKSYIPKCKMVA